METSASFQGSDSSWRWLCGSPSLAHGEACAFAPVLRSDLSRFNGFQRALKQARLTSRNDGLDFHILRM